MIIYIYIFGVGGGIMCTNKPLKWTFIFARDVAVLIWLYIIGQDIIRLPRLFRFLQKPLAQFISVLRAPKSKEGYASIGGGSPLRQITDAQAWLFLLTLTWILIFYFSVFRAHLSIDLFLDMILVIYDVYIRVYSDFWLLGW